jgi:hypothetical protein
MTFIPLTEAEGNQLDAATAAMDRLMALRKERPRAATLRTAIPHSYAPPDSYALDKLRKDLPPAPAMRQLLCPLEDASYRPGDGSAPDPYKIALQRQKENR